MHKRKTINGKKKEEKQKEKNNAPLLIIRVLSREAYSRLPRPRICRVQYCFKIILILVEGYTRLENFL